MVVRGEGAMPIYLTKFSYTAATWARLMEKPEDRRKAARSYIESVGGKLHGFWYAFGVHDGFTLWEAPRQRVHGRGRAGAQRRRCAQLAGDDSSPHRRRDDGGPAQGRAGSVPAARRLALARAEHLRRVLESGLAPDVAAQDVHVPVPRQARELALVMTLADGRRDAAGAQAVAGEQLGVEPERLGVALDDQRDGAVGQPVAGQPVARADPAEDRAARDLRVVQPRAERPDGAEV